MNHILFLGGSRCSRGKLKRTLNSPFCLSDSFAGVYVRRSVWIEMKISPPDWQNLIQSRRSGVCAFWGPCPGVTNRMLVLYLLSRKLFFFFYPSQLHSLWEPLCPAVKRSTLAEAKQQVHKDPRKIRADQQKQKCPCGSLGARSKVSPRLKHIDFIGFIDVLKLSNITLEGINSAYG